MRPRRNVLRSNSHPYLFTLMTLTAMAELGLSAFLISAGNQGGTPGYRSLYVRQNCIRLRIVLIGVIYVYAA